MFVEEETRRQNELMSPANKPLLSPEHPQSSSFFLAHQSSTRHLEKTKLSTSPSSHVPLFLCLLILKMMAALQAGLEM